MQNAEGSNGAAAYKIFQLPQFICSYHDAAAQLIDPFAAAVYVRLCTGEST